MAEENQPEVKSAGMIMRGTAADYPTVFADLCLYATITGGVVRLVFAETILEANDAPDPGLKGRHVGTLVMPVEGFEATLRYLNERYEAWLPAEKQDGE